MTKKEWIALSISVLSFILTRHESTVWIGVVLGGIMAIWWIIYDIKLSIRSKIDSSIWEVKENTPNTTVSGRGVTISGSQTPTLLEVQETYRKIAVNAMDQECYDRLSGKQKPDFHYEYYPDPYEKRRD